MGAGSKYDKASDHRRASGFSTPLLVSMETRTGTFMHTGAANRPSQGKRKTCVLLLAFHRLQSRCFQTPWNQSVVYMLVIQSRPSQRTPNASFLSLFVFYSIQAYSRIKNMLDTTASGIFNYFRAVMPVILIHFKPTQILLKGLILLPV